MNGKVRERLADLVKTHSVGILNRPDKVEALLKTSFGESETEITAIVTALREGLLSELLKGEDSSAQNTAVAGLSQRLRDNYGMNEEAATWAIESIALALGKLTPTGTESSGIKTANGDELVHVEGGTFVMGDTWGDGDDVEKPAHRVNITCDLYVGKYPVTFEEYDRFCMETGATEPEDEGLGRGRRPVVNVSWFQATWYCNWLSKKEGLPPAYYEDGSLLDENGKKTNDIARVRGYRLLSEAEWEYAARGGKESRGHKYSGSDDSDRVAWFDENSGYAPTDLDEAMRSKEQKKTFEEKRLAPHEVGMKMPNELGLYDMSGNVWEWCSDRCDDYADSEQTNPYSISEGGRVIRGGCWFKSANLAKIAHREGLSPIEIYNGAGFRICRAADRKTKTNSSSEGHERQAVGSSCMPAGEVPDVVLVERGSFKMGDTWGDGLIDEKPVHEVTIMYDFNIGKYEVLFSEFDVFCEATGRIPPSDEGWGRGDLPVINITWWDAVEFCNWLSEREGLPKAYDDDGHLLDVTGKATNEVERVPGYRLPTEAECEYAARGGNKSEGHKYAGSDYVDEVAWYSENSGIKTHEVGKKAPNELGIHDMSGNVWEWCSDWYEEDYYGYSPNVNPYNTEGDYERVMRGGSVGLNETFARVTHRDYLEPSSAGNAVGFRICRTAKNQSELL
ncbi:MULTISPECIES: formylglycine-generating enzyme family protein [unclassified Mesotoga]|uniref:formylglycine-generating enzyme family protein n=1 Tax=unclassified Mesotoga TaxID=1184398 RepID=UPI0021ACF112|nr:MULTISPECIES: formylglycine-generating enzyme family protein [unclassified Mesotoga]